MKYLNKILTVLLVIILSWLNSAIAQQGEIEANRMNRDINIMENILEEMFKVKLKSGSGNFALAEGGFFRSGREVNGTYLPGYGVIFMIPSGNTPMIYSFDNDGGKEADSYSFVYRSGDNGGDEVDEETVTKRIKEFLRDYGSTIGQLNSNEHVMVLYGHDRIDRELVFFDSEGKQEESTFPVISVAAKKKDLDAYRAGTIDDRQFDERLSVSTMDNNGERSLDMEVMANIFKTAFGEGQDEASFHIRGPVNHVKLDNFGALFFFEVSYSSSRPGILQLSLSPKVQIRGDSEADSPPRRARVEVLRELDKEIEKEQEKRAEKQKELEERTRNAFSEFKTQVKEYLVDYGRTLRSVGGDQFVMASITVSSRVSDLPERMDVQVKKSVLETLDRGSISREEAIDQVRITEY